MYQIKSNNHFNLLKIFNLLRAQNFPVTLSKDDFIYGEMLFDFTDSVLNIKIAESEKKINTPFSFSEFFQNLFLLLQDFNIKINELSYYPIKETITNGNKFLKLRNTHNLIIREAVKYKDNGLEKKDLYKIIWPNDNEIQINKLDTHLTNLKNVLFNELSYDFKFRSSYGKIFFN